MSEMVERVARAIFDKYPWPHDYSTEDGLPDVFRVFARAAIEAMRVPTGKMAGAGGAKHSGNDYFGPDDFAREAGAIWAAMIDTALSEDT